MRRNEIVLMIENAFEVEDIEAQKDQMLHQLNVEKIATHWDKHHPGFVLAVLLNTHDETILKRQGDNPERLSDDDRDLGVYLDYFLETFKGHLWENPSQVSVIQVVKKESILPTGILLNITMTDDGALTASNIGVA